MIIIIGPIYVMYPHLKLKDVRFTIIEPFFFCLIKQYDWLIDSYQLIVLWINSSIVQPIFGISSN